jgi:hypothetical protein
VCHRLALFAAAILCSTVLFASEHPRFREFKEAIATLDVGTSTAAATELRIGSPYWRRVFADGTSAMHEWAYPTSPRELTTLKFDAAGRLQSVTTQSWPIDVMFIHDDSPIMSTRGRAKLQKLRTITPGSTARDLARTWKPDGVLPYAQAVVLLDELKEADAQGGLGLFTAAVVSRSKDLRGDLWMYRCGDVVVTFEIGAGERIVSISEQLNPSAAQLRTLEQSLKNRIW